MSNTRKNAWVLVCLAVLLAFTPHSGAFYWSALCFVASFGFLLWVSLWKEYLGRSSEVYLNPASAWARVLLKIVLTPYRLSLSVTVPASHVLFREPWISEVSPRIYLGGRAFFWNQRSFFDVNPKAVLNVCGEFPENPFVFSEGRHCKTIFILDNTPPTVDQIREGIAFLKESYLQGHRVYVHCAYGHGRSAVIAAALLIDLKLAQDVPDAVQILKQRRRGVHLRERQQEVLKRYGVLFR